MHVPTPTIESLGDAALVVRLGDRADLATARAVQAALARIVEDPPRGIEDVSASFASLAVTFDPATTDRIALAAALRARLSSPATAGPVRERVVEIPVAYGGDAGPDLEAVAGATGLSAAEVVRIHSASRHVVGMIGFAPGFPYLLGLPESLNLPRRDTPRARVPAGSVAIAGGQTGIYPRSSPAGWHVVGRTPAVLFDAGRDPACLLQVGDVVRFVPLPGATPS